MNRLARWRSADSLSVEIQARQIGVMGLSVSSNTPHAAPHAGDLASINPLALRLLQPVEACDLAAAAPRRDAKRDVSLESPSPRSGYGAGFFDVARDPPLLH